MRVLLNALIIIIVVHILLDNLDPESAEHNEHNGHNENFESFTSEQTRLDYLLDDSDTKEDLLDFMKAQDVLPANYYKNANNVPNFDTNVTDLNKQFGTNYEAINNFEQPTERAATVIDPVSKSTCFLNECDDKQTISNVQWKYKDEQVQNGGVFVDGVTGFDNLGDNFAVYNKCDLNLQSKINDVDIPQNSNFAPF